VNGEAPRPARLVRAFVLAPLAAPAAYAAGLLGVAVTRGTLGSASLPSAGSAVDLLRAVAAAGVPLAYAATLVAGVPAYLLLRRAGIVARWTLWLGGGVIGVVVAWLLAPSLRGDLFSIPFPWWTGGLLGLASAEVFWRLLTTPRRRGRRSSHPLTR
jgi:hypothetical protein